MGDKLCDLRLIEEDDTDLIILLVLWCDIVYAENLFLVIVVILMEYISPH